MKQSKYNILKEIKRRYFLINTLNSNYINLSLSEYHILLNDEIASIQGAFYKI